MNYTIFFIILIALVLVLFLVPRFMVRRAVRSVVAAFRQNVALNEQTAKTLDELGLAPANRGALRFGLRDYRPAALQALVNANIIRMTEDGRFYLSEDALASTGLERR